MMDDFHKASDTERMLMTQLFIDNGVDSYIFTPAKGYDREEGYYTATTRTRKEIVFEVKNRNITSDMYTTTYIEKDKVDNILRIAKETNHIPFLFFFFTDNKYMTVKLDFDTCYTTIKKLAPKTTMGNQTKVLKEFVPFKITRLSSIN